MTHPDTFNAIMHAPIYRIIKNPKEKVTNNDSSNAATTANSEDTSLCKTRKNGTADTGNSLIMHSVG